jgi:hypothetical protein
MRLPFDKLIDLALAGYRDALEGFVEALAAFGDADPLLALQGAVPGLVDDARGLLADEMFAAFVDGFAAPLASLTLQSLPVLRSWRPDLYSQLFFQPPLREHLGEDELWDGVNFPSETPAWRPVAEAAVRRVKKWRVLQRQDFDRLRTRAKSMAWTVTGINSKKALAKVKASLARALPGGTSRADWAREVAPVFAKANLGPASMELVYRVAASRFWHQGQADLANNPIIGDAFPYVQVVTINDSRRTVACATMAHSGIGRTSVYRYDDPAYLRNRTPRHYNCRCKDRLLTVFQAARLNVPEAVEWERTGVRPKPTFVPYFEVEMPRGWVPLDRWSLAA